MYIDLSAIVLPFISLGDIAKFKHDYNSIFALIYPKLNKNKFHVCQGGKDKRAQINQQPFFPPTSKTTILRASRIIQQIRNWDKIHLSSIALWLYPWCIDKEGVQLVTFLTIFNNLNPFMFVQNNYSLDKGSIGIRT